IERRARGGRLGGRLEWGEPRDGELGPPRVRAGRNCPECRDELPRRRARENLELADCRIVGERVQERALLAIETKRRLTKRCGRPPSVALGERLLPHRRRRTRNGDRRRLLPLPQRTWRARARDG